MTGDSSRNVWVWVAAALAAGVVLVAFVTVLLVLTGIIAEPATLLQQLVDALAGG